VAALAAFSAGILSGVTGFGLAVIVVPLLLLVYDPKTVVALTGVLSLTVAAAVVHDSWREADHCVALALRRLVDAGGLAPLALFLMAATLVGKALGTKLLERVPPKAFRVVVLATVVLAGAMGVATATWALLS
jgi:uncharacterized protein